MKKCLRVINDEKRSGVVMLECNNERKNCIEVGFLEGKIDEADVMKWKKEVHFWGGEVRV